MLAGILFTIIRAKTASFLPTKNASKNLYGTNFGIIIEFASGRVVFAGKVNPGGEPLLMTPLHTINNKGTSWVMVGRLRKRHLLALLPRFFYW